MRKLICLALLSSLLLAGCASDARDAQPVPVAAPEEDASAPAADVFSFLDDEGNAAFSLVCDLGSGEETLADILRIRDAYEERFGVSLPVIDSGREDTGGAEIVVAARSRDDCAALLSSLKSGEYAISVTMDGDVPKINLAYKGALARMCAIDAMLNEVLNAPTVPAGLMLRGVGTEDGRIIEASVSSLRDPCVLVENGVYYVYGTGWQCYKNTSGLLGGSWTSLGEVVECPEHAAKDHWAPEVHRWRGRYYVFTTYYDDRTGHRGCSIFVSDTPEGPFREVSDGHVTPADWDAIDGTFYVDPDGQPWMIFVHEWTSTDDGVGRMAAAKLSDDLTHFISEPVELFRADDAPWAKNGVTDGCWMYRCADGQLLMLWSNWDSAGYCVGIARSVTGAVEGPWTHDNRLLYSKNMTGKYDGGHGMLFTAPDGQMYLSIHSPNSAVGDRHEKPVFIPVREDNGTLVWDTGSAS